MLLRRKRHVCRPCRSATRPVYFGRNVGRYGRLRDIVQASCLVRYGKYARHHGICQNRGTRPCARTKSRRRRLPLQALRSAGTCRPSKGKVAFFRTQVRRCCLQGHRNGRRQAPSYRRRRGYYPYAQAIRTVALVGCQCRQCAFARQVA